MIWLVNRLSILARAINRNIPITSREPLQINETICGDEVSVKNIDDHDSELGLKDTAHSHTTI